MKQLEFARNLRHEQTDCENLLWSRLRAHRLFGLKFRRQQPVGRYVVDFLCPERKLIVELDGGQHMDQAGHDAERDAWLIREGYVVLRYWNNEVMSNLEGVLEDVARCAGVNFSPPSDEATKQPTRQAKNACQVSAYPQPLPLKGEGLLRLGWSLSVGCDRGPVHRIVAGLAGALVDKRVPDSQCLAEKLAILHVLAV